jgi:predicted small integral membrane protein
MGLFAGLAAAGNPLDSDTNMAFMVRPLSMDAVCSASPPAWQVTTSHLVHQLVFWLIVFLERSVASLCLWARLIANLYAPAVRFNAAKGPAVHGLTLGIIP